MNENNIGIIKLYEKKEISIMCAIIGFTGKLKAQDVLLTGLASLEYRGYDSAGIAYFKDTGKISLRKTVGKVKDLRAICDDAAGTKLLRHRPHPLGNPWWRYQCQCTPS